MVVTTEFIIKLEENENVYIDGYIDRNDKVGEDIDTYSTDSSGQYQYNRAIIHNDDIDWFNGITKEQEHDIDVFEQRYQENVSEIFDIILQVDFEDTLNDVYKIERYGLVIEVIDVYTDCSFDSHDFLCGVCDKCNECGFLD